MSENATGDDQGGKTRDSGAPAIGADEQKQDGGPGSHTEDGSGGAENDTASGGVPEAADDDDA